MPRAVQQSSLRALGFQRLARGAYILEAEPVGQHHHHAGRGRLHGVRRFHLQGATAPQCLQQIVHEPLILFPRAPRPSFADQVLAAFRDRGLEPANMQEVRELQIALGLVAAGAGLSIVPKSVHDMQRTDVTYLPLDERGVTSPIVMAIRMLDDSQDLRNLLTLIYEIYDDEGIPYVRETL